MQHLFNAEFSVKATMSIKKLEASLDMTGSFEGGVELDQAFSLTVDASGAGSLKTGIYETSFDGFDTTWLGIDGNVGALSFSAGYVNGDLVYSGSIAIERSIFKLQFGGSGTWDIQGSNGIAVMGYKTVKEYWPNKNRIIERMSNGLPAN